MAAAEQGCLERAPGRGGVNGPPGPSRAGTDLPWDPRPRPPSLPGPVRPPALRARAVPVPCAPRSRPSHDPSPSSYSSYSLGSPWGRIPGEGVLIPWNTDPHHSGGESAKIPTKSQSKIGKRSQDLPAHARRLLPSSSRWVLLEDVFPSSPSPATLFCPGVGGQGRYEGRMWVPLIQLSLTTRKGRCLLGWASRTQEWRAQGGPGSSHPR